MSDAELRIKIDATTDPAGFEQAKSEIAGVQKGTESAGAATRAYNADLDASAAAAMRGGQSFRVLTDAERAANAAAAEAVEAQAKYSQTLETLDLRIGQVIRQEVSRATGLRAAGAAAASASEGIAAEVISYAGLATAIGAVVVAGAGLVIYTNNLEAQTKAAKEAGEAWDDYVRSRNKAIITAPTTGDAETEAIVTAKNKIQELKDALKNDPSTKTTTFLTAAEGDLQTIIELTPKGIALTGQLEAANNSLRIAYAEAAADRDKLPLTQPEKDRVDVVMQKFNDAALKAADPVQQMAQSAKNLQDYIDKAFDTLSKLQGGQAPGADLLANTERTAEGLRTIVQSIGDTGAKTIAAGLADGALKLTDTAKQYADQLKKVNDNEIETQKSSNAKIVDDQHRLDDLKIKQDQLTSAKKQGQTVDNELYKINEEIGKLTQDQKDNQLLIEQSLKGQADAANELKAINEKKAFDALPDSAKNVVGGIDSQLKALGKTAPDDLAGEEAVAQQTRDLRQQRKDVISTARTGPVAPGDTDNPFGDMLPQVATAVQTAVDKGAQAIAEARDLAIKAVSDLSDVYADGFTKLRARVDELKTVAKNQDNTDGNLASGLSAVADYPQGP